MMLRADGKMPSGGCLRRTLVWTLVRDVAFICISLYCKNPQVLPLQTYVNGPRRTSQAYHLFVWDL